MWRLIKKWKINWIQYINVGFFSWIANEVNLSNFILSRPQISTLLVWFKFQNCYKLCDLVWMGAINQVIEGKVQTV